MHVLAQSFTVSGTNHILILIAGILFVIAAVLARFVPSWPVWASTACAGLAVYMLALLFH